MNHSTEIKMIVASVIFSTGAVFASPQVTSLDMKQGPNGRLVTINYTLSEAPAVITLDVETNCVENGNEKWVSIGGEHVWNAYGSVWKKVTAEDANAEGKYTIYWRPDKSWTGTDGKGFVVDGKTRKARAKLTAWPLDNTPAYMVVGISAGANPGSQRYYPSVEFLPGSEQGQKGAITNNIAYKTSMLVMRKIMAKNVTWTMGSTVFETQRNENNESTHIVTLTGNYYIGVFEITQGQWANVTGKKGYSRYTNALYGPARPQDYVCYNEIRCRTANSKGAVDGGLWPNAPYEGSFLDLIRKRTGLDFDLPSEAQWEFACRAGNGDTRWNDGSLVLNVDDYKSDSNLNRLARNIRDGITHDDYNNLSTIDAAPDENGTAVVGSFIPNSWGIYDMHGNVREWCLDWYEDDITDFAGAVNVDVLNPAKTLSAADGATRVLRGGGEFSEVKDCRSASRYHYNPAERVYRYAPGAFGFRVICYAGIE